MRPTPPDTTAATAGTTKATRPVGVTHLIFGLIFTGVASTWLIGEARDTNIPDLAIGFPAVLIGAGLIGLLAVLVNHRRAAAATASPGATAGPNGAPDQSVNDTDATTSEEDQS